MNDEKPITLRGSDGANHDCRVVTVFEHEDREYALLLNLGEAGKPREGDPDPVLVHVRERDGEEVFETIEDDEEFDRVSAYVHELVAGLDDEEE